MKFPFNLTLQLAVNALVQAKNSIDNCALGSAVYHAEAATRLLETEIARRSRVTAKTTKEQKKKRELRTK